MDKIEQLSTQYHDGLITWLEYRLRVASAVTQLTESECAELCAAIEMYRMLDNGVSDPH